MEIKFDATADLEVSLYFDSPHVVFFDCWFRHPDRERWTKFASGKDQPDPTLSVHSYLLRPLPPFSKLIFELIFAGNPETAYKARIALSQKGQKLAAIPPVTGITNAKGVNKASIEIDLKV